MPEDANLGHRERLWRRCLKSGFNQAFPLAYEKLEFLLTFAVPRRDVKPLAKRLIAEFGSLADVLQAPTSQLTRIEGVGPKTAQFLRLFHEVPLSLAESALEDRDLLGHPHLVKAFLRREIGWEEAEYFCVLHLDNRNRLIHHDRLFRGTIDRGVVYAREVVKEALARNAAGVIIAHNHPSGAGEPSPDDIALTKHLLKSLSLVEIRLFDHLIVTKDRVVSLHETGRFPKVRSPKRT